MRRIGSWLPVLMFFCALFIAQGMMIGWALPDSAEGKLGARRDFGGAWEWSEIVRSDEPILERIPAPYVVLTIVAGAAVAMIAWTLLVRWTDVDEAL